MCVWGGGKTGEERGESIKRTVFNTHLKILSEKIKCLQV